MISRSQATSSVLKARPQQQLARAVCQETRRSISSKPESSSNAASNARTSRTIHTTPSAPQAVENTAFSMRGAIPLSSWDPDFPHPWASRRQKLSQDTYDNVVPAYYIERRRQRDEISDRKETEGGLMSQLSAGILSDGIAAQTRVRKAKVPVEVMEADGIVRFASGFEPPTPATEFHPVVAARMPEDDKSTVTTTAKASWDEVLSPSSPEAIRASLEQKPKHGSMNSFVGAAENPKETFRASRV